MNTKEREAYLKRDDRNMNILIGVVSVLIAGGFSLYAILLFRFLKFIYHLIF